MKIPSNSMPFQMTLNNCKLYNVSQNFTCSYYRGEAYFHQRVTLSVTALRAFSTSLLFTFLTVAFIGSGFSEVSSEEPCQPPYITSTQTQGDALSQKPVYFISSHL